MALRTTFTSSRRRRSNKKLRLVSTANLKLIHKTATKISNHALRSALLRLMVHQEQLKRLS